MAIARIASAATPKAARGDVTVDCCYSEVQGQCFGDCALYDGMVGTEDLVRLTGEWGLGGACDIDHDGEVDVFDLLAILSYWGQCTSGFSGGGEAMMAGGEGDGTLAQVQAFIEAVGGIDDATLPLLAAFLQHLGPGGPLRRHRRRA
jgi:hypothetical protein